MIVSFTLSENIALLAYFATFQGQILLYLASKTPPTNVYSHGEVAISSAVNRLLVYAPAFKDFLNKCLSNDSAVSAKQLIKHPFITDPICHDPKVKNGKNNANSSKPRSTNHSYLDLGYI